MANGYATPGTAKQAVRDMGKDGSVCSGLFYALVVGVGVGVVKTYYISRYLYVW